MFTLGNKEAIVNSLTQYQFSPALANTSLLNIQGFGTFDQTKIVSAKAARYQPAELAQITFTCPSAAALGIAAGTINNSVVVHLRVNSLRQASETAIDFIKRGRPLILEILVNGGDSAATVAGYVSAALAALPQKFPNAQLPFTAAAPVGAAITLTATQGYFQFLQNVTFLLRGTIFAINAVTSDFYLTGLTINDLAIAPGDTTLILSGVAGIAVNDTISFATFPANTYKITEIVTSTSTITFTPALPAGQLPVTGDAVSVENSGKEAVNDGKYLEENVRMSTPFTSDTYAINPQEVPIIGATYTMINFAIDQLGAVGGWQAHKAPGAVANAEPTPVYTLYYNDAVALGVGGPVELLITWLDVSGNVSLTDFKKANGASAESYADFIA